MFFFFCHATGKEGVRSATRVMCLTARRDTNRLILSRNLCLTAPSYGVAANSYYAALPAAACSTHRRSVAPLPIHCCFFKARTPATLTEPASRSTGPKKSPRWSARMYAQSESKARAYSEQTNQRNLSRARTQHSSSNTYIAAGASARERAETPGKQSEHLDAVFRVSQRILLLW